MNRPYNVLFVCAGNSARSIVAEALLQWLGAGKVVAYSAGWYPKGEVGAEIAAAFAQAHGRLQNRITAFLNLPMASLDRMSLQQRVDAIGQINDDKADKP